MKKKDFISETRIETYKWNEKKVCCIKIKIIMFDYKNCLETIH